MKYRTEKEIVEAIRKRYNKREPLNISAVRTDDPDLLDAAFAVAPFLGWKKAIEAAGYTYDQIDTRYIETIECRLCGAWLKSLANHLSKIHGYTKDDYLDEFPDAELSSEVNRFRQGGAYSQEKDFLPDWEPALSHEYCLDKVYAYYESGIDINFSSISKIDASVQLKLIDELGIGWDEVLEMLGLDPRGHRKVVRFEDFTYEDFREWLVGREKQGLKNTAYEVAEIEQEIEAGSDSLNCRIVAWALAFHNRSWLRALDASGVDLKHPAYNLRTYPDEESLLNAIREIDRSGRATAQNEVVRHPEDAKVVWAAASYFKTWNLALAAAKVKRKSSSIQYTGKQQFDRMLKKRIREKLPIDPIEMHIGTRRDIFLFKAAVEFYPSWQAAVKAVSNDPKLVQEARGKGNPYTTRAKVKNEFIRLHQNKELKAEKSMGRNDREFKYLAAMAHCFFGGWGKAATAAGIDRREYHLWNREPQAFYGTEEEVLEGIRWRHSEGYPMNARSLATGDDMDAPLITSARKLFGTWEKAVVAAGLNYADFVRKKQDYSEKRELKDYPYKKDVIAAIKLRVREGKKLNVRTMRHGEHRDHPLMRRSDELFGSWDAALKAAGQDPDKIRRKKQDYSKMKSEYASYDSKEAVIAEIKKRQKAKKPLLRKALEHGNDSERDFALWKAGKELFGAWENALEAAGVDLLTVFPEWQLKRMAAIREKQKAAKKAN